MYKSIYSLWLYQYIWSVTWARSQVNTWACNNRLSRVHVELVTVAYHALMRCSSIAVMMYNTCYPSYYWFPSAWCRQQTLLHGSQRQHSGAVIRCQGLWSPLQRMIAIARDMSRDRLELKSNMTMDQCTASWWRKLQGLFAARHDHYYNFVCNYSRELQVTYNSNESVRT